MIRPFYFIARKLTYADTLAHPLLHFFFNFHQYFQCQENLPTPGQPVTKSMFIPVAGGLLDSKGKDMPLTSVHHEALLQSVVSNGYIERE
ncbi:hypothetical protein QJS04_geneDACA016190 [Acorus gramineus]|uniref:Uncharacterized protein n=1 Tax=Acorus gramineus TaxID=55184 RepID=A0AAV9B6N1_ACOGR|nr:hypothetical protein QJS04_geneDACA016190 [Acorus gramineus]